VYSIVRVGLYSCRTSLGRRTVGRRCRMERGEKGSLLHSWGYGGMARCETGYSQLLNQIISN
jgi:hypothetical protein